jgi:hypothetical protein
MPSQRTSFTFKHRRPKPGTGFFLVRMAGWALQIVGGLLIAAGLLGFAAALAKEGPTLVGALGAAEQKMAGFIALLILSSLLFFVLLGLGGITLVGIGFAFGRWGTTKS